MGAHPTYIPSQHAVQRLQERHCPELTVAQARAYLVELAENGRARPTGRHWLKRIHHPAPGTTYVINSHDPDVALVTCGRVICTVLVRSMAAGRARGPRTDRVISLDSRRRWRKQDLGAELSESAGAFGYQSEAA